MDSNQTSMNIHDHGKAVDGKKNRVQCNYCDKEMSGFSRLRHHLGGIRGDVTPCKMVPENVRESLKNRLIETRRGILRKEVRELLEQDLPWKRRRNNNSNDSKGTGDESAQIEDSDDSEEDTSMGSDSTSEDSAAEAATLPTAAEAKTLPRAAEAKTLPSAAEATMFPSAAEAATLPSAAEAATLPSRRVVPEDPANSEQQEDPLSRQAKTCIGRFFCETGIDFAVVNSPSFQKMINCTNGCDLPRYKTPSVQELKGWILQDEVKEMQEHLNKIRQSWTSTGCSILLDGWTDGEGQNLVNFIVDCPQGPIYLRSSDVSAYVNNVDALVLLLEGVMKEVGVENVVQIIACSTEGWLGNVAQQFLDKCKTAFWSINAPHCIELILNKIAMMDDIREALDKAKIISKFVHGNAEVLKLWRRHANGHNLIKPSKIKSVMPFMALENILSEKKNLKAMFTSLEWNKLTWASTQKGKRVSELVGDSNFWKRADMVVKASLPLVRVLCLICGHDQPQMGYIYETMDQVKETIKDGFKNKKCFFMRFWEVIDEIWDADLHSPLHAAGYYLNPSLFYSSDFHPDSEVAFGLLCCIVRCVRDLGIQDLISKQLGAYKNGTGAFEEGKTIENRNKFHPAIWWSHYGGQCPQLQRFAIRILSQTCAGASKYDLNRSFAEKLLTKGRNPMEQQLLSDLIFVHYNLQLRLQHSRSGEIDDIVATDEIDPMEEWSIDDIPEIGSQNAELQQNGESPSSQPKKEPM